MGRLLSFLPVLVVACSRIGSAAPEQATAPRHPYFAIKVVDEATSRGIPCVRLRTVNAADYWTDNAGVVAFYEPDLMNTRVHFSVESHGYSGPKDGFAINGVVLETVPGGSATVKIRRDNIAQRLYRMTGAGLYRETELVGQTPPVASEPGAVPIMGQDGADAVVYRNKLYWFWGDTGIPRYPLGVFKSVCATSELAGRGGLDPSTGIAFTYLRTPKGDPRPIINLPGQVYWYTMPRVVTGPDGRERLMSDYCEIEGYLKAVGRGLLEFNDETGLLELVRTYPEDSPIPFSTYEGPPFRHSAGGKEWFYYPAPYPAIRAPVEYESQKSLEGREAFTCLKEGSRFDGTAGQLDRDSSGALRWAWRPGTSPVGEREFDQLLKNGAVRPQEAWYAVRDVLTGKPIRSHNGSVYWNEYRKRWICLRLEIGGDSPVGELWYLEGDTPMGPWVYARKVVTHAWKGMNYSFYCPAQIPAFDQEGGRIVHFKGSFSAEFGDNQPVPRHNYNNFMYRLELDDPRLALPVPVYRTKGSAETSYTTRSGLGSDDKQPELVWYAPDRRMDGCVPIYATHQEKTASARLSTKAPGGVSAAAPAFYAFPADAAPTSGTLAALTVPLVETGTDTAGSPSYAVASDPGTTGTVLCRVWPSPITFNPVAAGE